MEKSLEEWLSFLEFQNEESLQRYVHFVRANDATKLKVKLRDIAMQLNLHSVHHRAQINKLISAQGVPVPLSDYIFTALEEDGE